MKEEFNLQSIYKKYCENKNSHVYLVETNSIDLATSDVLLLIKMINSNIYNINVLVDNFNLPTLEILEPDGQEIKIEAVNRLINLMQKIPIITKENYFIIKNAEKLNQKSGNSLLKLIEEPETELLGFFICNNASKVLPTIQSRTQLLNLKYEIKEIFDDNILLDTSSFLEKIHNNISILDAKNICEKYKTPELMSQFLKCLLFQEKKYIKCSTSFDIIKKESSIFKLIVELESNIMHNGNMNLLFDRFVIEIGRL